MPSKSWKNHEKTVAQYFHGIRMSRSNYGIDAPDVLVPMTIATNTVGYKGDCIVECKYSTNMKWHKFCFELLNKHIELVTCEHLLMFDITNTKKIIPLLLSNQKIDSKPLDKKIPKYLLDWLEQSKSYGSYARTKLWLPLLCLGQKSSRNKLIIVDNDHLNTLRCSTQLTQKTVKDLAWNIDIKN